MTAEELQKSEPAEIVFNYIKSSQFRVIHCDGAIGGPTPNGNIHVTLYSERPAIPQVTVQTISNGILGEVTRSLGRSGVVRELEVDAILDVQRATALRDWLTLRIDELTKLLAQRTEGPGQGK